MNDNEKYHEITSYLKEDLIRYDIERESDIDYWKFRGNFYEKLNSLILPIIKHGVDNDL